MKGVIYVHFSRILKEGNLMKTCFIVSPIGDEGSDVRKRADQLYKYIIEPVCTNCGFEAVRVDQINQADSITQTIIDYLKNSELVIADMTGHNPNAFYEMGYRASTNKPMIHVKEKGVAIPFDISSIRAFDYNLTDLDSVAEVKSRLEQTINAFDFDCIEVGEPCTENDASEQGHGNLQVLPVLYEIQDQITQLTKEIHDKDTETIQTIVKACQPATPAESVEATLIKTILPEMLKNPASMKALMELGENAKRK